MQEQLDGSINAFIMAKDRARKLIQMDANGTLDKVKRKALAEDKMSYGADGIVTNNNYSQSNQTFTTEQNQIPNSIKTKSKLPTEILESFKKNPSYDTYQGSVLDEIQKVSGGKVFTEQNIVKDEIPTQHAVTQNIDYSMIKMIVEECMRKYTSALKKTIMTESKNNLNESNGTIQALKIGDKFSFITNNGDLYEAKLTFIKNINSNKKGGK
jgi:hypothetical protein